VPGSLVGGHFVMSEIADFGAVILLVSAGLGLALLSMKLTERLPIPSPAIFLLAAAAASDLWPSLYQHATIRSVERIAVVALIVILFNGGLDIGRSRFRKSAFPIVALGVFGTFMTAGIVMLFAHYALGFGWMLAGVAGAALAPTDPAVMFSVLGNHEIGGRSGTTLEGEAGLNDPAGIALMIGMIELATHADASATVVVREFAVEMVVGAALGIVGGWLLAAILRRIRLPSASLHPLLALVLAAALYGGSSLLHGSGFLAVFLAGLIVGGGTPRHKTLITSFSSPLASLAEIAVFVALGLTGALSSLSWRTWFEGVVLMLALAVVARPVTVIVTLAGARFSRAERAFMAWSGLKGAVPILLAAFALLERVDGAQRIYSVVFVVVLLSVICQGTLVGMVARRLGIPIRDRPSTA
jgi:cell volume regulation protein A